MGEEEEREGRGGRERKEREDSINYIGPSVSHTLRVTLSKNGRSGFGYSTQHAGVMELLLLRNGVFIVYACAQV